MSMKRCLFLIYLSVCSGCFLIIALFLSLKIFRIIRSLISYCGWIIKTARLFYYSFSTGGLRVGSNG